MEFESLIIVEEKITLLDLRENWLKQVIQFQP
jgi:hypothetical protein